jgi:uncharacterized protein (TIGR04255 family)
MGRALPLKLKKEPLIDAIFELRFDANAPASVILPGLLFEQLKGGTKIEALPIAQLPKHVRDVDPNLRYQPLSRIDWDKFYINISDFSISVNCKFPYPGWSKLRIAILEIVNVLKKVQIITGVERYSLKYIDLVDVPVGNPPISVTNLSLSVATCRVSLEQFQVKVDLLVDGFLNSLQIISSAKVMLNNGTTKDGLVIDVDTIGDLQNISLDELLSGFSDRLDLIHDVNKKIFFDCLSSEGLELLEPIYG